jgi:hypothetical protein
MRRCDKISPGKNNLPASFMAVRLISCPPTLDQPVGSSIGEFLALVALDRSGPGRDLLSSLIHLAVPPWSITLMGPIIHGTPRHFQPQLTGLSSL